jgi:NAD(P)-dependent dehydrogenase (short-subunit alcohol dehydrogenase family)
MLIDYRGKAVLVTGATKGIGLATALSFARRGAHVTVTHRWGSADEESVRELFRRAGAPLPDVVESDAGHEADVRAVLARISSRHGAPTAIVSNVAVAPPVRSNDDYVQRNLHRTIDYTAWPLVSYTLLAHEVCGTWPRYVVGISSAGAEAYHHGYDFAGVGKAALETLARYLAHRLSAHGVRVNVVRTHIVRTDSLRTLLGEEFETFVAAKAPHLFTPPELVGEAVYGACSGLMDAMTGQVLTVDGGARFADNFYALKVRGEKRHDAC